MEGELADALAHCSQLHFPFVTDCRLNKPAHSAILAELYDTPWDHTAREAFFCSPECEDVYCHSGSFDYVECGGCGRRVCEQNPSNGWHLQFREHPGHGYVCLRCYEGEVLANGQPRSDFEGDRICGGMFFSRGNVEPMAVGFEEVEPFRDYLVQNRRDCVRYNQEARERIDGGSAVLTAFERLAIGRARGLHHDDGACAAPRRGPPAQLDRSTPTYRFVVLLRIDTKSGL